MSNLTEDHKLEASYNQTSQGDLYSWMEKAANLALDISTVGNTNNGQMEQVEDFGELMAILPRGTRGNDFDMALRSAEDVVKAARTAEMAARMALRAALEVQASMQHSEEMKLQSQFVVEAAQQALLSASQVRASATASAASSQRAHEDNRIRTQNEWLSAIEMCSNERAESTPIDIQTNPSLSEPVFKDKRRKKGQDSEK